MSTSLRAALVTSAAATLMAHAAAPQARAQIEAAHEASVAEAPAAGTSLAALADEARLRVRAATGVWYASASGETRFGSAAAASNLEVQGLLDLDDNEPTFAGDVMLFIGERWLVHLSAFDFATESTTSASTPFRVNGTAFAAGTGLASDFGLTGLTVAGGYDFFGNIYERIHPRGAEAGPRIDTRAHLLAAVRGVNVDHRLAVAGGPTVRFDEWAAAIGGGARVGIGVGPDFAGRHRWDVDLVITYALGGSSDADLAVFDLAFGIHYTIVDHFGLVFGYRHTDIDFDAEDAAQPYRFDGRLAGLFFGAEVKF